MLGNRRWTRQISGKGVPKETGVKWKLRTKTNQTKQVDATKLQETVKPNELNVNVLYYYMPQHQMATLFKCSTLVKLQ